MNSISKLMSAEDIAAEIRMERQSWTGTFFLVEGVTDVKRFERFIDERVCSVVTCWGRVNLLGAVKELSLTGKRDFVALADADFDRVLGKLEHASGLYYSDGHDFDIDMVRTRAFERYMRESSNGDKCSAHGTYADVAVVIAQAIKPVSAARHANARGKITVSLADVDWAMCFGGLVLNVERYAYQALKKLQPSRAEIEEFVAQVEKHLNLEQPLWQITNGHDFFIALGLALRADLGERKAAQTFPEEVEMHMRLAFDVADFKMLPVFQDIISWQRTHAPKRILLEHLAAA